MALLHVETQKVVNPEKGYVEIQAETWLRDRIGWRVANVASGYVGQSNVHEHLVKFWSKEAVPARVTFVASMYAYHVATTYTNFFTFFSTPLVDHLEAINAYEYRLEGKVDESCPNMHGEISVEEVEQLHRNQFDQWYETHVKNAKKPYADKYLYLDLTNAHNRWFNSRKDLRRLEHLNPNTVFINLEQWAERVTRCKEIVTQLRQAYDQGQKINKTIQRRFEEVIQPALDELEENLKLVLSGDGVIVDWVALLTAFNEKVEAFMVEVRATQEPFNDVIAESMTIRDELFLITPPKE